jgi:hypothetical protein
MVGRESLATSMLNETDIHYIAGYLHLVSGRSDVTVILGDKVYDEAAEKKRDVDIVIATAGEHGVVGVEVKDERDPLDVGTIEALCQKFADMPSITRRSIVSDSGYTAPARRKAKVHGVECLTLVSGRLPSFPTIDLSGLTEILYQYPHWHRGPHITLLPGVILPPDVRAEFKDDVPVRSRDNMGPRTLRELAARIVNGSMQQWQQSDMSGPMEVTFNIEIADKPVLCLASREIEIGTARLEGTLEWIRSIPARDTRYLEDGNGNPSAGVVLAEIKTGLIGIMASATSNELHFFHIPEDVRKVRPIRKTISRQ